MKKVIITLCSLSIIISSTMLSPITAYAGNRNCGHNSYVTDAYLDPNTHTTTHSHQYLKGNGHNGPIYGTCHVTECFGYRYPQCAICGDVDFSHPHEVHLYSEHENCGLGIIY